MPDQRALRVVGQQRPCSTPLLAGTDGTPVVGGRLLFDVTSAARFAEFEDGIVSAPDLLDGFWAEPPYVGVRETWVYQDLRLALQRYTINTDGSSRQFWNWTDCLTSDDVATELAVAGLATPDLYGDVAGSPLDAALCTFAIVTQRVETPMRVDSDEFLGGVDGTDTDPTARSAESARPSSTPARIQAGGLV